MILYPVPMPIQSSDFFEPPRRSSKNFKTNLFSILSILTILTASVISKPNGQTPLAKDSGLSTNVDLNISSTQNETTSSIDNTNSRNSKGLKKPPLGWISSSDSCKYSEDQLKDQVTALEKSGLKEAGFNTFILGCGWHNGIDQATGKLKVDEKRFQGGIPSIGNFLKEKQMNLGLQIDSVTSGCPAAPRKPKHHHKRGIDYYYNSESTGLLTKRTPIPKKKHPPPENPTLDSARISTMFQQINEWGVKNLQFQPCLYAHADDIQTEQKAVEMNKNYIEMKNNIEKSQCDLFFGTGQWGIPDNERQKTADSWKINNPAIENWQRFRQTVNTLVPMARSSSPGKFNDLGFIEYNKFDHGIMNPLEIISHIIFWAASKSPLILSGDLKKENPDILKILKNPSLLEVNQDPLGESISFKRRYTNDRDIWSGNLQNGSKVAVVINWKPEPRNVSLPLSDIGLKTAHGYDILTGEDLGKSNDTITQMLGGHAIMFLKLNETESCTKRKWIEIPVGKKPECRPMGKAVLRNVTDNISAMTQLDSDYEGSVEWRNIDGGRNGGKLLVAIDYINPNIDDLLPDQDCPNCRIIKMKVNEKEEKVELPISGFTKSDIFEKYLVELDGFERGSQNKLTITGGIKGKPSPDIVKMSFFVENPHTATVKK